MTKTKTKKKQIGHVVVHTHWDREWRYPLWKNRMLLVEMMDQLLDILEQDPEYKSFMTDGQCVLVQDYLEIRPENEARVRDLVTAGRLKIGPWYTLPDLHPIDGECLIRNLLKGIRCCAKYGGHMPIAYHSFGWGQTAQFPQIYKGFGIDFAVAAKRVSEARAPACEFLWEGPDGTRMLTTRLGKEFRANLFVHAYIAIRYGIDYLSHDYVHRWGQDGLTLHNASPEKCHEDFFKVVGHGACHEEMIAPTFDYAWHTLDDTTVPDVRLVMDGSDFTDCQPDLPRILAQANARCADVEYVFSTLEAYAADLKQRIARDKLTVVRGELRDGPSSAYAGNALATRNYLKILNKRAQNLLIRRAEPLAALLAMMGDEYPKSFLDRAWDYLLKSHAHDSINGVTQDKTANDVEHRLEQVIEMAEVVHQQSIENLVKRIDLSAYNDEDVLVVAVNPLAHPVHGVQKLCIDLPREQSVWEFGVVDSNGQPCDVQPISRREKTSPVNDMQTRPWPFYHDRHMCYVDLGDVPAGGYKVMRVVPKSRHDRTAEWWEPIRTSTGGEISTAPNMLENEHLAVSVESNGSLTLTDKSSGVVRSGLHVFEDSGDAGDYWVHYPPYENKTFTSLTPASIRTWCADNGPLSATIGVELGMMLPVAGRRAEHGYQGESCRSSEMREVKIVSYLTLTRGARRLDFKTVVDNSVEDHRLRVLFPTDLENATQSHASGHFTVDAHPIDPPRDENGEFYPESQTHPTQHFVDLSDGKCGLAIVHNCFTEYEALRDSRRTLALTLFRSVNNRIATEYRSAGVFPDQKGSQSLRTMEFSYAIYPHEGGWSEGQVYAEAERLNTPPTVYQISAHQAGTLPPQQSLFAVEPQNLILSACKRAEDRDAWIVRLFNPTAKPIKGGVTMNTPVRSVRKVMLNEVQGDPLDLDAEGRVVVSAGAGEIVTLEFETEHNQTLSSVKLTEKSKDNVNE